MNQNKKVKSSQKNTWIFFVSLDPLTTYTGNLPIQKICIYKVIAIFGFGIL